MTDNKWQTESMPNDIKWLTMSSVLKSQSFDFSVS